MTPKEKALELIGKFYFNVGGLENKKQCSLIVINELIKQESKTDDFYELGSYWQQVKQEIIKL